MPEQDNTFWDAASENYRFDTRNPFFVSDKSKYAHLRKEIARRGIEVRDVLEVGCGSATMAAFFAKDGATVHALDASEGALDAARRRFASEGVQGHFHHGNAFKLPFPDGTFDLVMSNGLLEHFEDMTPVVKEMVRVLRPGGLSFQDIVPRKFSTTWLFDVPLLAAGYVVNRVRGSPEADVLKERFKYNLNFFRGNAYHSRAAVGGFEVRIKTRGIRRVLTDSGLVDIDIRGAGVLPMGLANQGFLKDRDFNRIYGAMHALDNRSWTRLIGMGYWTYGVKPTAAPGS